MSENAAPPRTAGRRVLRFATPEAVLADVAALRRVPHARVGRWTLPQVCQHLATVITGNLTPPPTDDPPTAEQLAMKAKFFGTVLSPAGMPEGMPLPPDRCPPATCGEAEVDAVAQAFAALAAYPHARLMVGRCGPVPTGEVRDLHLAHCAHHLSFLSPPTRRVGLAFDTADAVAADVAELQKGYVRSGNWTLPQACWHLKVALDHYLSPGPHETPVLPEGTADRLAGIMASGRIPDGLPAAAKFNPPADATAADVAAYLDTLRTFLASPGPFAPHRLFGPLPPEQLKALQLIHAAHHLAYLIPTGVPTATVVPEQRPAAPKPADHRAVRPADLSAAIAEVDRLRRSPCRQLGDWNLPTIARHVLMTMPRPFAPPADPTPTPEQAERQQTFIGGILANGGPPPGLESPARAVPPPGGTDADVDALVTALAELAAYPHATVDTGRGFGPVPTDTYRKLTVVHLSHHLGFLVPIE